MSLNNNLPTPSRAGRIEYIDALRGFTMFLVVVNHLAAKWCYPDISFHYYLKLIRMPMFFLISGFVFYKAGVSWNKEQIVSFLKKKIPVQLIGPLVFYVVYVHVIYPDMFLDMFFVGSKYGYWFTFVLFEYFIFYIITRLVFGKKYSDVALVILGICMYPCSYPLVMEMIPIPNQVLEFFSFQHWHFFIFFVLGTLLKKHFDKIQTWLDGKWLITVCILVFFLWNAVRDIVPLPKTVFDIPLELTGIVVLFSFFRKNQEVFSKQHKIGRVFQYVGRRTLDIYLIHFFLVPFNLSYFTVFRDHSMPIIEFFVSACISLVIIGMCLIISNILRLSPVIARWFFGVKTAK